MNSYYNPSARFRNEMFNSDAIANSSSAINVDNDLQDIILRDRVVEEDSVLVIPTNTRNLSIENTRFLGDITIYAKNVSGVIEIINNNFSKFVHIEILNSLPKIKINENAFHQNTFIFLPKFSAADTNKNSFYSKKLIGLPSLSPSDRKFNVGNYISNNAFYTNVEMKTLADTSKTMEIAYEQIPPNEVWLHFPHVPFSKLRLGEPMSYNVNASAARNHPVNTPKGNPAVTQRVIVGPNPPSQNKETQLRSDSVPGDQKQRKSAFEEFQARESEKREKSFGLGVEAVSSFPFIKVHVPQSFKKTLVALVCDSDDEDSRPIRQNKRKRRLD